MIADYQLTVEHSTNKLGMDCIWPVVTPECEELQWMMDEISDSSEAIREFVRRAKLYCGDERLITETVSVSFEEGEYVELNDFHRMADGIVPPPVVIRRGNFADLLMQWDVEVRKLPTL